MVDPTPSSVSFPVYDANDKRPLPEIIAEHYGFPLVFADDTDGSTFAWQRKSRDGRAPCVVIVNFTPEVRYDYRVRVPRGGRWREILNSDSATYGGSNVGNAGEIAAFDAGSGPELNVVVPPLAGLFLVPES